MLERADVACRNLQVDVPFHSAKMDPLEAELLESLHGIRPRAASVPLFSTVTGRAVAGPELDARYWFRNVRQPVLFAECDPARYRLLGCTEYHDNCADNLRRSVAAFDVTLNTQLAGAGEDHAEALLRRRRPDREARDS